MKLFSIVLIFITNVCFSQEPIQGDIMLGVAGYNGDLTKSMVTFKSLKPAIAVGIKFPVYGNFVFLRTGIAFGWISGDDKNNKSPSLSDRNLNFTSKILEGSLSLEVNLLDPNQFYGYPYLFAGVGLFHFNPYTKDNGGKKVFLWDLGTEGQGLAAYPDRKMYSLTQVCLPFGGGWRFKLNDQVDIGLEVAGRVLFTDYLDDVSTTYAAPQVLLNARGPQAMELAYRYQQTSAVIEGRQRGNPKHKDWYFFSGIKLQYKFGAIFETQ
ncbi:MAG: DUF6089 family protein [Ferruginibacter sp.]